MRKWLKVILYEKCEEIGQFSETYIYILQTTEQIFNVKSCIYMEGIKYVNLIGIGPVVIEIWEVQNSD